jgi:hypothetical protein
MSTRESNLQPQPPAPDTGPVFTESQRMVASQLVHLLGYKGGYTLALALQNYAELAEQESMERDKIYTRDECLQLANALMQLIPEDWQPEEAIDGGTDSGDHPRTEA